MTEPVDGGGPMQKLLSQAFGGDKDALGRLLDLHRGYLRAIAQRELGGKLDARLDASDLVQQTCLSACREFSQFEGRQVGEFIVWLGRIHEQNIKDVIRAHVQADRRAVDRERRMDALGGQDWAADSAPSPSARMLASEQAVVLTHALEKLPELQREAIRLRYLEGLPVAEIANRLGCSVSAVAGLLKRGMRALRERLNENNQGAP